MIPAALLQRLEHLLRRPLRMLAQHLQRPAYIARGPQVDLLPADRKIPHDEDRHLVGHILRSGSGRA